MKNISILRIARDLRLDVKDVIDNLILLGYFNVSTSSEILIKDYEKIIKIKYYLNFVFGNSGSPKIIKEDNVLSRKRVRLKGVKVLGKISLEQEPRTSKRILKEEINTEFQSILNSLLETKKIGKVEEFIEERGFGFISINEVRSNLFFHISYVVTKKINKGDFVIFTLKKSKKDKKKYEAHNILEISQEIDVNFLYEEMVPFFCLKLKENILSRLTLDAKVSLFKDKLNDFKIVNTFEDLLEIMKFYFFIIEDESQSVCSKYLENLENWIILNSDNSIQILLWLNGTIKHQPDFKFILDLYKKNGNLNSLNFIDGLKESEYLQLFNFELEKLNKVQDEKKYIKFISLFEKFQKILSIETIKENLREFYNENINSIYKILFWFDYKVYKRPPINDFLHFIHSSSFKTEYLNDLNKNEIIELFKLEIIELKNSNYLHGIVDLFHKFTKNLQDEKIKNLITIETRKFIGDFLDVEFRAECYIFKDFDYQIRMEEVVNFFNIYNKGQKRLFFSRLNEEGKGLIIEELCKSNDPVNNFIFIIDYLYDVNKISKEEVLDFNEDSFWDDKLGHKYFLKLQYYYNSSLSEIDKVELYLAGYLENLSKKDIIENVIAIESYSLYSLIKNSFFDDNELEIVLSKYFIYKINLENYIIDEDTFIFKCRNLLDENILKRIDSVVSKSISLDIQFLLWEKKYNTVMPIEILEAFFNNEQSNYEKIEVWLKNQIISKEQIVELFFKGLIGIETIDDRFLFYKCYFHIIYLLKYDSSYVNKIIKLKNDFFNLVLWHKMFVKKFNFKILKRKFIFFKPEDQVFIFKRLFYLKHIREIDFAIDELDEILRADVNLYLLNEKFKNDFVLDISTHILIEAIKEFTKTKTFKFESKLILEDLRNNADKKFKIEHYFEKCPGRSLKKMSFTDGRKIEKRKFKTRAGETKYFYKIDFEFDLEIVNSVKKITGSKYYADARFWGAPLTSFNELKEFADVHSFFIELNDGQHYSNNLHLLYNRIDEVPKGVTFCEGRKANKIHSLFKCDFWWCKNTDCFSNAEVNHLNNFKSDKVDFVDDYFDIKLSDDKENWEAYTFLDILRILKIDLTEFKTNPPDTIVDGHYYKFLGHINAFNRLAERLTCECCDQLLYPVNTSHFALYLGVQFRCINNECKMKHKTIYLNTCFNGECKSIIDSRVSKKCKIYDNDNQNVLRSGMYICEDCGSCCSHSRNEKRLNDLKHVGGFIHPELIDNVENKRGHLEKKEYSCFNCGDFMTEIHSDLYECDKCKIEYDFTKYKWLSKNWTNIHLRRKDYKIF